MSSGYVELHAHSAYSFLDGASQPEELAARAVELGYDAFALTDHDGVYGSLEFAYAAKHLGLRAITGAEVTLEGGSHVTLLCESRRGYENLCRILTDAHARTRAEGRERELLPAATSAEIVAEHAEGLVCLSAVPVTGSPSSTRTVPPRSHGRSPARSTSSSSVRTSAAMLAGMPPSTELAATLGVPTVATGDVHAHHPRRSRLQDVLVAIRNRTSLDGSERERRGNHESVLLSPGGGRRAAPAPTPSPGRARSPIAALSTSPRSSATATPTSPTGPTPPTASCASSASAPSPSATPTRTATRSAPTTVSRPSSR